MKTRHTVVLSIIAGAALGAAADFVPGSVVAQPMEKKGTTPYVTHFIFRPLMSIDIPGLGTATNLSSCAVMPRVGNSTWSWLGRWTD